MSLHRRAPMSPLSAAMTLAQWTQTHGREPRCMDCVGQEGLHWYATYYDAFAASSWSAILSTARTLTSGWGLSVIVTTVGHKPCLNAPECPALIPDEGPGIRLCLACQHAARQATEHLDVTLLAPALAPRVHRRWGFVGDDIEDALDGIDWGAHGGL